MTIPHPHADLLRAIADGRQMQIKRPSEWRDCDASTALAGLASVAPHHIRIKPDTVIVNGVECPAPMTEAPEGSYWIPIIDSDSASDEFWWRADHSDLLWLERGLCFATEADAQAVAEAMLKPLREYVARAKEEKRG